MALFREHWSNNGFYEQHTVILQKDNVLLVIERAVLLPQLPGQSKTNKFSKKDFVDRCSKRVKVRSCSSFHNFTIKGVDIALL